MIGAAAAATRQARSQQGQRVAAQRQAGGGVVERDGFAFGSFEQLGLFVRALDDRRLGKQAAGVDALMAGRRPELAAAVAGQRLQRVGLGQRLQFARVELGTAREIGCYYGGMLARAGHAVTLIGRAQHVDAVRRDGLWLDTQSFQIHLPVQASAVRGAQWLLCCVKSTETERAAADMAPHLDPDALVLSQQNGVDNAERLQSRLPRRVASTVVYGAGQ